MLDLVRARRTQPAELLVVSLLEERLERAVEREARVRVSAGGRPRGRSRTSGAASGVESMSTRSPGWTAVEYPMATSASRSTRGSGTAARGDFHGGGILEEHTGLPDELAVGVDLAVGAQVADQVPVEPGRVLAARLRERAPSARCIVPPIFSSKRVLRVKRSIS